MYITKHSYQLSINFPFRIEAEYTDLDVIMHMLHYWN